MKLDPAFLERLSTAAIDEGLADAVYGRVETAIGLLLVAQSRAGVCRVCFADEGDDAALYEIARGIGPRVVASDTATAGAREELAAYLDGDLSEFDVPIDMSLIASDFQKRVLTTLRRVPRGRVTTYGELATRIGHPGAARATGTALGRNPIPIIVPCHRVIQGTGAIGGYGGSPWRKRFLLELEGAIEPAPSPGHD